MRFTLRSALGVLAASLLAGSLPAMVRGQYEDIIACLTDTATDFVTCVDGGTDGDLHRSCSRGRSG